MKKITLNSLLIPTKVIHSFFHDTQVVWRGIDRDLTALHQRIASRSMLSFLNGLSAETLYFLRRSRL